jgi:hypothetical protein
VSNTGFGVLTLNSNILNDIHFSHISVAGKCSAADQFVLHVDPKEMAGVEANFSISFLIWGIIASLMITTVIVKRKGLQRVLMRWKRRRSAIPMAAV